MLHGCPPSPDAWGRLNVVTPFHHLSGDSHINSSLREGPLRHLAKRRQNLRWPSYGSGIFGTNAVCQANCVGIATLPSFPAKKLNLLKNAAPAEYLPSRVL